MDASLIELYMAEYNLRDHVEDRSRTALIAAQGEHLPFKDASFDTIFMRDVVEHLADQPHGLQEAWRVLRPGGRFFFNSPNRYALWLPEPHVGLYGVGFLPRRLMDPYVRWRRQMPYQGNRLLGFFELAKMLRGLRPRPRTIHIEGAPILREIDAQADSVFSYRRVCNWFGIRLVAPEHNILLVK